MPGTRYQTTEYTVQDTRDQSTDYKVQRTTYNVQGTRYKIVPMETVAFPTHSTALHLDVES